jgi:hypothetical protein
MKLFKEQDNDINTMGTDYSGTQSNQNYCSLLLCSSQCKKNKQLKYAFEKLMLINETQKIEITLLKQLNNLLMEKIEYNKTAKSSINISKSTLNVNKFNRERILKNKTC